MGRVSVTKLAGTYMRKNRKRAYAVVRYDHFCINDPFNDYSAIEKAQMRVKVVDVVFSEEKAEKDAERLNKLNSGLPAVYFVQPVGVEE